MAFLGAAHFLYSWAVFGLDRQNLKNNERQSTNFNLFFLKTLNMARVPLFRWAFSINSTISLLYLYINRVYLCCRLIGILLVHITAKCQPLTASTGFIRYNTIKALWKLSMVLLRYYLYYAFYGMAHICIYLPKKACQVVLFLVSPDPSHTIAGFLCNTIQCFFPEKQFHELLSR